MSKPLYVIVTEEPESFRDRGNFFLLRDKLETIGYKVKRVSSLEELNGENPRVIQINPLKDRHKTLNECIYAKAKYKKIRRVVLTTDIEVIVKLQILKGFPIIDTDLDDYEYHLLRYATSCAGPTVAMIRIGNRVYAGES
ncbi:MAG: hypothetical protein ABIJ18_01215 [archaeon]